MKASLLAARSPQQTVSSRCLRHATVVVCGAFFVALLVLASRAPLTFDEAFNANVALSASQGLGYGTHTEGDFRGFNPRISTGFYFIAPLSFLLWLNEPGVAIVQVYSLTVTAFFMALALIYASRAHRALPLLLILLSVVFLDHGKSDLVPLSTVASIPEPPYGLWFQFLGNMAGIWAVIGVIFLAAIGSNTDYRGQALIFCGAVFACNAKIVHALPIFVGLAILLAHSPKLYGRSCILCLAGAFIGTRTDGWLAAINIEPDKREMYAFAATQFFRSNQASYVELLSSPSTERIAAILGEIQSNWKGAVAYVGEPLTRLFLSGITVVAFVLVRVGVRGEIQTIGRTALALGIAAISVVLWWSGMPHAPLRFLTPVAPLAVSASACALIVIFSAARSSIRFLLLCLLGGVILFIGKDKISSILNRSSVGQEVRREQLIVAQRVRELSNGSPTRLLCGGGWWYPHEAAFLTGSPRVSVCKENSPRLVVIPKHIFPAEVRSQRLGSGCGEAFQGAFYEIAVCEAVTPG